MSKVGDKADEFFNDSYMHEIRLYFNDPNWYDTLYNAHNSDPTDPYFPARFASEGIEIEAVGVRFKGMVSFGGDLSIGGYQGVKKPFRIDFNMYDDDTKKANETTFFGLKKLDLHNGYPDPTMLREKLFMDFASHYVPTPRSVYTYLYINDNYYGIYLAVEHIDNTFVESRFGSEENGNIYKVEHNGTLEYLGSDVSAYNGPYELKNNEEVSNWSDLIELTNVLTNTPIADLPSQLEPIFDVETGLRSLALLDLFSSYDSYLGYARNYYLYHRNDTNQFTFLLWDAHLSFGAFAILLPGESVITLDPFPRSTLLGNGAESSPGESGKDLVLIKNVLAVESYNQTYLNGLTTMIHNGFNVDSINTRIQELAAMIRIDVNQDSRQLLTPVSFDDGLPTITNFVMKRSAYLDTRLDEFSTAYTQPALNTTAAPTATANPSPTIPEFPSWIILPIFSAAILLTVVSIKKKPTKPWKNIE